jgi:hypothetical protein
MSQEHLADDRLIDLCLRAAPAAADRMHLAACALCESRRLELVHLLDDAAVAATREADRAFPADRLARQHTRILQRIDQDGRPGRVIAFPANHPQEAPVPMRPIRRSSRRVAAVAAAAGLIIGLLAGHLAELPGKGGVTERAGLSGGSAGPLRAAVLSDDEFLGQIELAVGSATPAVLNPLDALTPGAWDLGR